MPAPDVPLKISSPTIVTEFRYEPVDGLNEDQFDPPSLEMETPSAPSVPVTISDPLAANETVDGKLLLTDFHFRPLL